MIQSEDSDEQTEGAVDRGLDQKIAAETLSGVVHRRRCGLQVARAAKAQDAVAQIFPVKQDEHQEQDEKAAHADRLDNGAEQFLKVLKGGGLRFLHLHLDRSGLLISLGVAGLALGGRIGAFGAQLRGKAVQCRGRLLERARRDQSLIQRCDFLADIVLIFRNFTRQMRNLYLHDEAEPR